MDAFGLALRLAISIYLFTSLSIYIRSADLHARLTLNPRRIAPYGIRLGWPCGSLSIYLSIYMYIYIYVSIYIYVYLSICIRSADLHADPAHRPVRDSLGLALRIAIYLSIYMYLYLYLSIFGGLTLSISMYMYICIYIFRPARRLDASPRTGSAWPLPAARRPSWCVGSRAQSP